MRQVSLAAVVANCEQTSAKHRTEWAFAIEAVAAAAAIVAGFESLRDNLIDARCLAMAAVLLRLLMLRLNR